MDSTPSLLAAACSTQYVLGWHEKSSNGIFALGLHCPGTVVVVVVATQNGQSWSRRYTLVEQE